MTKIDYVAVRFGEEGRRTENTKKLQQTEYSLMILYCWGLRTGDHRMEPQTVIKDNMADWNFSFQTEV